jgi:hypothetical protein
MKKNLMKELSHKTRSTQESGVSSKKSELLIFLLSFLIMTLLVSV